MSAWEDVLLDSGDQRQPAEWWWAYVTDTEPLRIRRELEDHPIGSTPSTLIAGLEIGDKVRVVNYLGLAVIVGRAGGPMLPADRITGVLSPAQLPDIPEISDGPHYLRIGDDGAPRLFTDREIVYDRAYSGSVEPDNTRLMVITTAGTIGTLDKSLSAPYLPIATGSVDINATPSGSATVTFPSGLFTSAPYMAPVAYTTSAYVQNVQYVSVTASSATIVLQRISGSATHTVRWVAIGV